MFPSVIEYQRMANVEAKLWWYRGLHSLVHKTIQKRSTDFEQSILDAGCGTGGLISFLEMHGYRNLTGFDRSPVAVSYCHERQLRVSECSIIDAPSFYQRDFDVIVSNDVLYFYEGEDRLEALKALSSLLAPSGLMIINLPAYEQFRGTHDLSVGIRVRTNPTEIRAMFRHAELKLERLTHWPFVLSPIIAFQRARQRRAIRSHKDSAATSDIDLPRKGINSLLEQITKAEHALPFNLPWGSSIFAVGSRIP